MHRDEAANATSVVTVGWGNHQIVTTTTSTSQHVEAWIDDIYTFIDIKKIHKPKIGLATQGRHAVGPERKISLLQLCVANKCLLFQIHHANDVPEALSKFLNDVRLQFYGVGIKEDVNKLVQQYSLQVRNAVDLRVLAAQVLGRKDLKKARLKALAYEVMDVDIDKPRKVATSDWEDCELSKRQIAYACLDAFFSKEIGSRLRSWEPSYC